MANNTRKPLSRRLLGIILVITATACWATSGIFINLIVRQNGLSAVGLAFWRDLTTTLLLLAGILIVKPHLLVIKKKDLPWLIGMGAISIGIFHVFWNTAVVMIGASLATVVQCNAPIFVTIMAWFLFGEKITLRKVIAVVLAAVGTILVSGISSVNEWKILPLGSLAFTLHPSNICQPAWPPSLLQLKYSLHLSWLISFFRRGWTCGRSSDRC
ncbi:MAG: DMT family transporter [Anaerolineales bacterium]